MFGKLIPSAYDTTGRKILRPAKNKYRVFNPTAPMGRFISKPLETEIRDFKELRLFLKQCRYVSDVEQFNKRDYWLPPEEFERLKKGDCEDFSLWTWRQLMLMGYKTRFVVGMCKAGGHAWVTVNLNGEEYLCEPLAHRFKRLSAKDTFEYKPEVSVEVIDGKPTYFAHKTTEYTPSFFKKIFLNTEHYLTRTVRYSSLLKYLVLAPYTLPKSIITLLRKHLRGDVPGLIKRYSFWNLIFETLSFLTFVAAAVCIITGYYYTGTGLGILSALSVFTGIPITLVFLFKEDLKAYLKNNSPVNYEDIELVVNNSDTVMTSQLLRIYIDKFSSEGFIELKNDDDTCKIIWVKQVVI